LLKYLLTRLALAMPTVIGITFVLFMAVRFLPGDVIDVITEGKTGAGSAELRKKLEERYSLDGNLAAQYVDWMSELVSGDLGTSIVTNRSVVGEMQTRLPVTAELGALAFVFSLVVALPTGLASAIWQGSAVDYLGRSLAILLLAVPAFWLALLALTYGVAWFGWTPPLTYSDLWDEPARNLKSMWLPAGILGASLAGSTMRFTRSAVLDVLRQDYIRTARAKGLRGSTVIVRHAVRNALVPVVTIVGLQVPALLGGSVILEQIFGIPGMGTYLLNSLQQRDYPAVQAVVLVSSVAVVLTNIVVDISYSVIDPRIRHTT
jgi:peptide/nickel transport system permease protein